MEDVLELTAEETAESVLEEVHFEETAEDFFEEGAVSEGIEEFTDRTEAVSFDDSEICSETADRLICDEVMTAGE